MRRRRYCGPGEQRTYNKFGNLGISINGSEFSGWARFRLVRTDGSLRSLSRRRRAESVGPRQHAEGVWMLGEVDRRQSDDRTDQDVARGSRVERRTLRPRLGARTVELRASAMRGWAHTHPDVSLTATHTHTVVNCAVQSLESQRPSARSRARDNQQVDVPSTIQSMSGPGCATSNRGRS